VFTQSAATKLLSDTKSPFLGPEIKRPVASLLTSVNTHNYILVIVKVTSLKG
jgi:hypothetical protein